MRHFTLQKRYDKMHEAQRRVADSLRGEGRYVFQNALKATLHLPKPALNGATVIAPLAEFEGDNYFMQMVKTRELRYIREIEPPAPRGVSMPMNESQTLIVDQPDRITEHGKVETTIHDSKTEQKKESHADAHQVLITENPLDGVDILAD